MLVVVALIQASSRAVGWYRRPAVGEGRPRGRRGGEPSAGPAVTSPLTGLNTNSEQLAQLCGRRIEEEHTLVSSELKPMEQRGEKLVSISTERSWTSSAEVNVMTQNVPQGALAEREFDSATCSVDTLDSREWPPLCGCGAKDRTSGRGKNNPRKTDTGSLGPCRPNLAKAKAGSRSQRRRKAKWKAVFDGDLGFYFNKLEWSQGTPESDDVEDEIKNELELFENLIEPTKADLENVEQHPASLNNSSHTFEVSRLQANDVTDIEPNATRPQCGAKAKHKYMHRVGLQSHGDNFLEDDNELDLLEEIPHKFGHLADRLEGLSSSHRLRRKRKWRRPRARLAVKTIHFRPQDIVSRRHDCKLYVSQRVLSRLQPEAHKPHYLPKPAPVDRPNVQYCENRLGKHRPSHNHKTRPPKSPRHAITANNADSALPGELVNVLVDLQHRELTPEDYEILLRLDEGVKPKTVDDDVLGSFRTEKVTSSNADDVIDQNETEPCAVCLEPYSVGQNRKYLPCGHVFHGHCIDVWLRNSSMNCPLDGLPIS